MARKKRQFFSLRPVLSLKHLLRRAESEAKKTNQPARTARAVMPKYVKPTKAPKI